MDFTELLEIRKSVRSYTNQQVESDKLTRILKAANLAPVGRALYENVHLTVVENKELLALIDKKAETATGRAGMLYGAPVIIVISAKPTGEELANLEYSNAAIVAHNMSMAAVNEDLGSCYIWGATNIIRKDQEILSKLNLPAGFIPCCSVIIGHTNEAYEKRHVDLSRIKTDFIS